MFIPIGPVYMTPGLADPSCDFSISSNSYTHLATWLISNSYLCLSEMKMPGLNYGSFHWEMIQMN